MKLRATAQLKEAANPQILRLRDLLDFGNDLSSRGYQCKRSDQHQWKFNAEKFHIEGAFQIRGLVNAGELELKLHGPSEAREIGGETITVKREGRLIFPRIEKMIKTFGFNTCLISDVIEGDDIYLEYTTAKIIRGNNIELGPGCEIELIEYKNSYKQDEKSVVTKYKKM